MLIFVKILQLVSALLLILLILLHSSKGEGIGSIGGSAQMFKSGSQVERGLNIVTWIVGIVFLGSIISMSWFGLGK
ncbi:MAG: preprotein translocase subunit SecG [Candidatus Caenarcaniphilales bacterium]|nr:preprotein translocase subunit SecG [Candidatus Caenarcaniphilales bacterium]